MALNFLTILSGMSLDFETVSEPNRLTEMNICYLSTFLKVKAELNSVHLLLIASTLGWSLHPKINLTMFYNCYHRSYIILDSKSGRNIDNKFNKRFD